MKNFKKLTIFLMMFALIITFSGFNQTLAKGNPHSDRFMDILKFDDTDIPNWAEQYIAKMQAKNIFTGYKDGKFRPNKPVSHVEAVITAVRLMELEDEAKSQDLNTSLPFKDAKLLDGKYFWAKGYVLVALENELFDANLDKLQPSKAASREWVAKLLVRALDLEDEAQRQMTRTLNFTDADDISADAVGYISVAEERGIVTGYNDGSFQPNKPVTRAEMAALLSRTNDEYQEENEVLSVTGKVKALSFDTTSDDEVDGTISLQTFDDHTYRFAIDSDLLVQYYIGFITADLLEVGNYVSLDVEDGVVIEAAYLDDDTIENGIPNINEFKLDVKFGEENAYKLFYMNRDGEIRARVERINGEDEEIFTDQAAAEQVKEFVDELELNSDMTREQIKTRILEELQINDFEELEIKITFSNGKRIHIEVENQTDEDANEEVNEYGIDEFDLKVTTENNEFDWTYQYEDGEIVAEKNYESAFRIVRRLGDTAKAEIEDFFQETGLDDEMTEAQIMEEIIQYFELEEENGVNVQLDVTFSSEEEISFEREYNADTEEPVNTERNINYLVMNLETDLGTTNQWEYIFEDGAISATISIENVSEDQIVTTSGVLAKNYIEDLALNDTMETDDIMNIIYDTLEIEEADVVSVELDIVFTSGVEISLTQE